MTEPLTASCTCGAVRLRFTGPLIRAHCHCTICQRVNEAPYGDPVLVWRHRVDVEGAEHLSWTRTRWLPVHVNRGSCTECGQLIFEHIAASPFSIVIGQTFDAPETLPPLSGHMFYDSRVADVEDGLPKHEGWVSSQLAFVRWAAAALAGR